MYYCNSEAIIWGDVIKNICCNLLLGITEKDYYKSRMF